MSIAVHVNQALAGWEPPYWPVVQAFVDANGREAALAWLAERTEVIRAALRHRDAHGNSLARTLGGWSCATRLAEAELTLAALRDGRDTSDNPPAPTRPEISRRASVYMIQTLCESGPPGDALNVLESRAAWLEGRAAELQAERLRAPGWPWGDSCLAAFVARVTAHRDDYASDAAALRNVAGEFRERLTAGVNALAELAGGPHRLSEDIGAARAWRDGAAPEIREAHHDVREKEAVAERLRGIGGGHAIAAASAELDVARERLRQAIERNARQSLIDARGLVDRAIAGDTQSIGDLLREIVANAAGFTDEVAACAGGLVGIVLDALAAADGFGTPEGPEPAEPKRRKRAG